MSANIVFYYKGSPISDDLVSFLTIILAKLREALDDIKTIECDMKISGKTNPPLPHQIVTTWIGYRDCEEVAIKAKRYHPCLLVLKSLCDKYGVNESDHELVFENSIVVQNSWPISVLNIEKVVFRKKAEK